jgi:hypothetical protein
MPTRKQKGRIRIISFKEQTRHGQYKRRNNWANLFSFLAKITPRAGSPAINAESRKLATDYLGKRSGVYGLRGRMSFSSRRRPVLALELDFNERGVAKWLIVSM